MGWDAVHPRALARLSSRLIRLLILVLLGAELKGEWPEIIGWIIIVRLPKPDGGRRPIGLIPLLPRVWYRVRRSVATQWEKANSRTFLYGGAGMGAEVAAWKQSARVELAAVDGKFFAQGLLDLVKAYERIPHWVLLREALRHGYPIWLLELSIAVYRLLRVIRVDEAVSEVILAVQGIIAGSEAARTEMRLLMIDVIDKAFTVYPCIQPTVFVDDVSAEMADHNPAVVERQLAGFLLSICSRLTRD